MKIDAEQVISTKPVAIQELSKGQEELWDAFVDSHPRGTIYHRTVWRRLITDLFGHETYYMYARGSRAEIVGVLPLVRLRSRLFGDFMVSMPYFNYGGAIGEHCEIEEALMDHTCQRAADMGVDHVEFRDTSPRPQLWPPRTDKVAMELPLPGSADTLWAGFSSKLRAQIRRPQKEEIAVVGGGRELVPEFYRVFAQNMRDLGTPVYSIGFFDAIAAAFPDKASLIVLRYRARPIAAAFLLGFKGRLEIPWASSIREFNRIGINMLLYWEALKTAIAADYEIFDFGRSSIDSGTYRFKSQWGARPRILHWHYWVRRGHQPPQLTPSNPKYRTAIRLWQHLPLFVANFVGPRIVKHLP